MALVFIQPFNGINSLNFPGGIAGGFPVSDSTTRSQTAPPYATGTRALDLSGNEYTLVKAGAAIAVNEAVRFNAGLGDCQKTSAANQMVLGVATAAFASADFGFLLTKGSATCKVVGATAVNSILASTATAGTLGVAVVGELQGRGAVQTTAEAGGLATVQFL